VDGFTNPKSNHDLTALNWLTKSFSKLAQFESARDGMVSCCPQLALSMATLLKFPQSALFAREATIHMTKHIGLEKKLIDAGVVVLSSPNPQKKALRTLDSEPKPSSKPVMGVDEAISSTTFQDGQGTLQLASSFPEKGCKLAGPAPSTVPEDDDSNMAPPGSSVVSSLQSASVAKEEVELDYDDHRAGARTTESVLSL
jgi:hypothetical protein